MRVSWKVSRAVSMAGDRWIFTKQQIHNSPSRKVGIDSEKELSYRQQGAQLIQDVGQKLQVTQLCINTAIVYMHRFYMFHSFTKFHRNEMAAACLFLAAKVEEQPRKLEHVVCVTHRCMNRNEPAMDPKSEKYLERAQEQVVNENILLQTLGFEITVDHPHTHVIKACQLVRASKDLTQTSYFLATNSLHLTSLCLQYKPTVVACTAIHLACKWSDWEFPKSSEGKDWWSYVDKSVTLELLEELTQEFLNILDKCPTKLKQKIMTYRSSKDSRSIEEQINRPKHVKTSQSASAAGSEEQLGKDDSSAPSHRTEPDRSKPKEISERLAPQTASLPGASDPAGLRRVKSDASITLSYNEYKERSARLRAQAATSSTAHRNDAGDATRSGYTVQHHPKPEHKEPGRERGRHERSRTEADKNRHDTERSERYHQAHTKTESDRVPTMDTELKPDHKRVPDPRHSKQDPERTHQEARPELSQRERTRQERSEPKHEQSDRDRSRQERVDMRQEVTTNRERTRQERSAERAEARNAAHPGKDAKFARMKTPEVSRGRAEPISDHHPEQRERPPNLDLPDVGLSRKEHQTDDQKEKKLEPIRIKLPNPDKNRHHRHHSDKHKDHKRDPHNISGNGSSSKHRPDNVHTPTSNKHTPNSGDSLKLTIDKTRLKITSSTVSPHSGRHGSDGEHSGKRSRSSRDRKRHHSPASSQGPETPNKQSRHSGGESSSMFSPPLPPSDTSLKLSVMDALNSDSGTPSDSNGNVQLVQHQLQQIIDLHKSKLATSLQQQGQPPLPNSPPPPLPPTPHL